MVSKRICDLELQYKLLQEQLNVKELEKIIAPLGDQVRIQHSIDLSITPQLKDWKQKYLAALAEEMALDSVTEQQAEVVL